VQTHIIAEHDSDSSRLDRNDSAPVQ
jgi:hypothetical protein